MIEYVIGAAVAVYLCGIGFFVMDEIGPRRKFERLTYEWYYIPFILLWPLGVAVSPITRWAYRKWWMK